MNAPQHLDYGEMTVANITQGMLEDYYRHLRENKIDVEGKSLNEYAGDLVRAAVAVGWFPDLTVMDVRNLPPWKVIWLYQWINGFLVSALGTDPNSSGLSLHAPEIANDSPQKN
jgi:hypothetical protein